MLGDTVPAGPAPGRLPGSIAGSYVTLRRPGDDDALALFPPTHGAPDREAVWAYMGYGPWGDAGEMQEWIDSTVVSRDPFWWVVLDAAATPVGMASVLNVDRDHRRAEIGHIWYVPGAHRTEANTEAAYLMMRACFDDLAARRVEWKCDALNQPSREAALRLGFRFEGVFRNHMIVKGRNRDTAWYAVTDDEWPPVRTALEAWLVESDPSARPSLAALR